MRAADVDRWSGGRLGYVHIESMGDDSFRSVYSDILGKYNNREGIVIDTRFNGGGRLHEDIEILFSGQKYFTQVVRGREACDMPSRRWNKPSIMVMCEANYSNAHGTPWVYSHRGIGKLVGMPVPGTIEGDFCGFASLEEYLLEALKLVFRANYVGLARSHVHLHGFGGVNVRGVLDHCADGCGTGTGLDSLHVAHFERGVA